MRAAKTGSYASHQLVGTSSQLAINRLSNNAGVVKYFFPTLLHAPREERHFAPFENSASAIPTQARS
jgi:hypothetical protein